LDNGTTNISMPVNGTTNCFINMTNQSEATYTYKVWTNDTSGNWGNSSERYITLDTTDPAVNVSSSAGASTTAITTTILGTATDSGSGILNVTVNGVNATLNISGAYSLSVDLIVGSNLINVTVYDNAGNSVSNTSVTVTRTTTSTGGGGGSSTTNKIITIEFLPDPGVNVSLRTDYIAKFIFDMSYQTIKVIKLGNDYVTLEISSNPAATLNLLESGKFDLNNDNYYDLYIKLNKIKNNQAYLTVMSIHEIITPVVTPPAEEEPPVEEPIEEPSVEEPIEKPPAEVPQQRPIEEPPANLTGLWILIAVVAIGLIAYFIYKKKKEY
jgi:hypothetical protein